MRKVLTLGGHELEFSLGLGFLGEVLELTGWDIEELGVKSGKNPWKTVPLLMFVSAKYCAEVNQDRFDFSIHDFNELVDIDGGVVYCPAAVEFMHQFNKWLTKDVPKDPEPKKVPKNDAKNVKASKKK